MARRSSRAVGRRGPLRRDFDTPRQCATCSSCSQPRPLSWLDANLPWLFCRPRQGRTDTNSPLPTFGRSLPRPTENARAHGFASFPKQAKCAHLLPFYEELPHKRTRLCAARPVLVPRLPRSLLRFATPRALRCHPPHFALSPTGRMKRTFLRASRTTNTPSRRPAGQAERFGCGRGGDKAQPV